MVTKTAREILEAAKYLAGVRNSKMTDFFQVVNVMNNIYKDVYRKIVSSNNLYIREYKIDAKEWNIPREVFTIYSVYFKNNDIVTPICRGSYGCQSTACYYIENNKLKLYGIPVDNVYVKCSLLPETITCPDDSITAPVEVTDNGYLVDNNYYFSIEDQKYVWNIANNQVSQVESFEAAKKWSKIFDEKSVSFYPSKGYIVIDHKDATDTFLVEDNVRIVAASFYDPYALVSYDNGHTYLFKAVKYKAIDDKGQEIDATDIQHTRWNPDAYTGHDTLAQVISLYTNDMTGQGVVYLDLVDNKIKFGSFVPDTIISSPANILFTYIECKLAAYLTSITGNANEYLASELLPAAEQELYDSLSTDQASPVQMQNVLHLGRNY